MERKWAVHAEARQFAARCDQEYGALRLYPFVRRFNCTNARDYRRAVDQALAVTVSAPHHVPGFCWNIMLTPVRFARSYAPVRNPHVNEWHKHNPLPGTVYDLPARLAQPSLIHRRDFLARLEKLNQLAPYNTGIMDSIFKVKYNNQPSFEQATALCQPVLSYSPSAMIRVARTLEDKPEQYEKLMLQAAELSPFSYYALWRHAVKRGQPDKAIQYLDQACAADPDAVRAASQAEWRVRYYLQKGQTQTAGRIAEEAAETYSAKGLHAKAVFLEAVKKYEDAFEWFVKIEERYGDSTPVLNFCVRYKTQTGETRFEAEARKRLSTLFPKGLEQVSLADFQGSPPDGVFIKEQNELVRSAGLKSGDVIVAVYGVRVHNLGQYQFARETKVTPQMDLIVWQGDSYREFKPVVPDHLFGVDFGNYPP